MDLPIVDLDVFLSQPADSPAVLAECEKAADALITYGALVLHDGRVSEADNAAFLDLLEDYFAQPAAALQRDERPVARSGPVAAERRPAVEPDGLGGVQPDHRRGDVPRQPAGGQQ